jgi:hypothetical protein
MASGPLLSQDKPEERETAQRRADKPNYKLL